MTFDCPYGWKSVNKFGNITFESATVEICDGICDSCDLCGVEHCEFDDISSEVDSSLYPRPQLRTDRRVPIR